MKTVEELLIQRYKVIAPYPQSSFEVGDIISFELQHVEIARYTALNGDPIKLAVMEKEVQKYPHLFQPLPWYAERKPEDLPEYIKCDERVWKITEWKKGMLGKVFPMNEVDVEGESENFANIKWHFSAAKFLPCTSEDYEQWKQSKNKQGCLLRSKGIEGNQAIIKKI
jgi:hypothetical protein